MSDEQVVEQFDEFADTDIFGDTDLDSISVIEPFQSLDSPTRAATSPEWPPAPPLPGTASQWAVGTDSDRMPVELPTRRAGIYRAVRVSTTSSEM